MDITLHTDILTHIVLILDIMWLILCHILRNRINIIALDNIDDNIYILYKNFGNDGIKDLMVSHKNGWCGYIRSGILEFNNSIVVEVDWLRDEPNEWGDYPDQYDDMQGWSSSNLFMGEIKDWN